MAFGEEWSVYEERESGCYRKLRECETGLLIRKRHCEMFLKHYTCVLKCFKTLYHKQRLLSSGQSHWFLIPSPDFFLHWHPQGAWQEGCHCRRPASSPEWRGPSTQIVQPLLIRPGDGSHRPADTSESDSLRPEQKTPLTPEALAITAIRISIFPFFPPKLWV